MGTVKDFYIDSSNTEEANFEYFLEEELNIKSITLKNVSFYNSWWTADLLPHGIAPFLFTIMLHTTTDITPSNKENWCKRTFAHLLSDELDVATRNSELEKVCNEYIRKNFHVKTEEDITDYTFPFSKHFSLSEFCNYFNETLKKGNITHATINCDQNNYLILELTEDREFKLSEFFEYDVITVKEETNTAGDQLTFHIKKAYRHIIKLVNKWFGFKQKVFTRKGKYYSTRPLPFYVSNIILRCNLVEQRNTLYNNKPANILCVIPVDDGDQIKHQRYKSSCNRTVNKLTNHLKLEITDANGKVVNFRGTPVIIHLQFEVENYNKINVKD